MDIGPCPCTQLDHASDASPPRGLFIRMGFAYANEHIIQYMNNVKAPYNVNRLSQEVAVRALADRTLYQERVTAILKVCVRPLGV